MFSCTNFSDGCEGNITIGNPQICTIENVLVFCEVTVDPTIQGFSRPAGVAYDEEHDRMYVANFNSGTVSVFDTSDNTVIDTDPIAPGITPFTVGSQPVFVAYDPNCRDMYVTNQGGTTVSVIDTTTNQVIDRITVGNNPRGIAYDIVHERMYVANLNDSTVSAINLCGCPPVPPVP